MSVVIRLAVGIYQKILNKRSFWRKLRFEYTYRVNRGFGGEEHHKRIAADIVKNIPKANYKSALDLGCGLGFVTAKLAEKIPAVTGVDISSAALSVARIHSTDVKNITFVQHDIIGYCSGKHDLIVCVGILPYLPERYAEKVAININKMLAKGGALVIFEKAAYTGTPIEKYLRRWKYPVSKKRVKVAGENFLMWIVKAKP